MNVATPLIRAAQPEAADIPGRAPAAPPEPKATAVAGIAVLSADPDLREMLGAISSALATITLVEDWAGLLDTLTPQACGIALLDADEMEASRLDARLAELERQPVAPVIIVAAGRERAKECMEALAAGRMHRLLLKPATTGGLRLAIDYAIARSRQQHPDPVAPAMAHDGPRRHRGTLLAAAMLVVFVVTVLGALRWQDRSTRVPVEDTPAPAPAPTLAPALAPAPAAAQVERPAAPVPSELPAPTELESTSIEMIEAVEAVEAAASPAPREIDRVLRRGEASLQSGELIRPQFENAFSHYLRAAAIDPSDPGVAALRTGLREAVVVAALQALEAGDVPEAEALVDAGGDLGVNAVVLGDLTTRVVALRASRQAEQQAAREAGLLAAGLERLGEQRLLEPRGDSAVFYLGQLRAENPDHPGLAAPWAALLSTLARNTRDAVAAEEFVAAADWIEWLRRIDAYATLIGALVTELASARRQREFLASPALPSELKLIHSEPLSYPRQALLRNLEGWVDIDFVVDHHGLPRDIEITGAEPPGFFERSATRAVSLYRYEPYVLEGHTYERRVALRLLFTLD